MGGRARILDGRALILNAMLATQDVTVGPASADPPALALRAGGTALVSIEPEELSYSPASSSSQDSSPELIHWRRHALPGNFDRVCSDRPGDYGAGLRDSIAELYPKGASRGRCFPVHPAGPRSGQDLGPAG